METTSPTLIKRIFPLTLMATREHCDFASACNPIKVLIALPLVLPYRVLWPRLHTNAAPRGQRENRLLVSRLHVRLASYSESSSGRPSLPAQLFHVNHQRHLGLLRSHSSPDHHQHTN